MRGLVELPASGPQFRGELRLLIRRRRRPRVPPPPPPPPRGVASWAPPPPRPPPPPPPPSRPAPRPRCARATPTLGGGRRICRWQQPSPPHPPPPPAQIQARRRYGRHSRRCTAATRRRRRRRRRMRRRSGCSLTHQRSSCAACRSRRAPTTSPPSSPPPARGAAWCGAGTRPWAGAPAASRTRCVFVALFTHFVVCDSSYVHISMAGVSERGGGPQRVCILPPRADGPSIRGDLCVEPRGGGTCSRIGASPTLAAGSWQLARTRKNGQAGQASEPTCRR